MATVLFYETETGETPVETFIQSLPAKHGAKVYWEIELLEEHGKKLERTLREADSGRAISGPLGAPNPVCR